MESQPQNPEFRNNPENFHECIHTSCADPESFLRGGPTLTFFLVYDEGRVDPSTTIRVPLLARQRNAI